MNDPVRSAPARRSLGRSIGFWSLIVVAGVTAPAPAFAVWVNTLPSAQASSRTRHEPARPTTRSAAPSRRGPSRRRFTSVDVQSLSSRLAPRLESLSGVAAAGARQVSYQVVDRRWATGTRAVRDLPRESPPRSSKVPRAGDRGSRPRVVGDPRSPRRPGATDRISIGEQVTDQFPGPRPNRRSGLRQLSTAQDIPLLKALAWVLPIRPSPLGAVWLRTGRRKAVRSVGWPYSSSVRSGSSLRTCAATTSSTSRPERNTRPATNGAWDILTEVCRLLPTADHRRDPLPRRLWLAGPDAGGRPTSHLPSRSALAVRRPGDYRRDPPRDEFSERRQPLPRVLLLVAPFGVTWIS